MQEGRFRAQEEDLLVVEKGATVLAQEGLLLPREENPCLAQKECHYVFFFEKKVRILVQEGNLVLVREEDGLAAQEEHALPVQGQRCFVV